MGEGVAEGDSGPGGFDEFTGTAGFEHAGLCGHAGGSFYTGEVVGEGEIRNAKFGMRRSTVGGQELSVREKRRKRARSTQRHRVRGDSQRGESEKRKGLAGAESFPYYG